MSYQNIKSDLLVELSTEEQQFLSGGRRPIILNMVKRRVNLVMINFHK
ncbi:MAG: hypothetical protein RLZZ86_1337 [Cyanobacteriota bacterium]